MQIEQKLESLQQQIYDLQNQLQQYEQLKSKGVTLESYEKLQQNSNEQSMQIRQQQKEIQRLNKTLENNALKQHDKEFIKLKQENEKLRNDIKQLKQRPLSPSKIGTPIKVNPSAILKKTQDLSKEVNFMLLMKAPSNFNSPYVEISKGKFENVKLIKQLKQGFEKSYFDQHHFDTISYELNSTLKEFDRFYNIQQGNGLLTSNQLCIIFGCSKTSKKQFLIQSLETLLTQFRQQYDLFLENLDFKGFKIRLIYEENINGNMRNNIEEDFAFARNLSHKEEYKRVELIINKVKLIVMNKMKLFDKDNSRYQTKVRQLMIECENEYNKEKNFSRSVFYTSNHIVLLKNIQFPEEALKEFLQQRDKGKFLTDFLKLHSVSINIVLCVQPSVPFYQQTHNTFQLSKVMRNIKYMNSPQQVDKFSQLLENQVQQLEAALKLQKQKTKGFQWEAYRAKKQVQNLIAQNDDAVQKNKQLKQQFQQLVQQIQQIQSNFSQQISIKQEKSLSKTQSILPLKSETVKTLESAQKSLSNILSKHSQLDMSISPTKIKRDLFQDIIKPSSSEESVDQMEQIEDEQSNEQQGQSSAQRKESMQSMI